MIAGSSLLIPLALAAAAAACRGPVPCSDRDTTRIALELGDSASLDLGGSSLRLDPRPDGIRLDGGRLSIRAIRPGRMDLALRSFVGRRTRFVRVDVFAPKDLALTVQVVGVDPSAWTDAAGLGAVEQELSRLFRGTGIHPRLLAVDPVRLPASPSFWDPEGDGHLDLVRNDDSAAPAPALDSLARWMERRRLRFPRVVVLQVPVRVGWSLARDVSPADSLIELSHGTTLPWRDGRGAPFRYVVGSPAGRHADTFEVTGYVENRMRFRTMSPDGRFSHRHPARTDLVLRPDREHPAFGVSASWIEGSPPIVVLPDARRLHDARRAARVIAHEVAHTLGLVDLDDKTNLMSGILRMDVESPSLRPEQVARLHESLKSHP